MHTLSQPIQIFKKLNLYILYGYEVCEETLKNTYYYS